MSTMFEKIILNSIDKKKLKPGDQVLLLEDNDFSRAIVDENGDLNPTEKQNYQSSDISGEVEKMLRKRSVKGIATNSKPIVKHLSKKGTFSDREKVPYEYSKNNRTYLLF